MDEETKEEFGKVWEEINKLKKENIPNISKKQNSPESTPSLIKKLIDEDKFFEDFPIRTTQEIQERLIIKFGKKIPKKNAARDFLKISKSGVLERDWIKKSVKYPKGLFIWFIPGTPKEKIEEYKNRN